MQQLKVLRDIMADSGLSWWLDSGTLLGIVREGHLLASDHDIDLGVWRLSVEELRWLQRRFSAAGHEVLLDYYQGEVFRLWLWPRSSGWRKVDVRVFQEWDGRFAWSPRTQRRDYFSNWPTRLQTPARNVFRKAYLFWNYRLVGRAPRWAWPVLDVLTDTHCWWVPARFFRKTVILGDGWSVPEKYEEYLTYRYGDWRVPVPDWRFKVDDPTYKKLRPEKLFEMASNGTVDLTGLPRRV